MSNSLRIGLAGVGTVGASVAKLIETNADQLAAQTDTAIRVTALSARDKSKDRGFDTSTMDWYDNAMDVATSDNVDVFVEMIGGDEGIAYDSIKAALNAGKSVVTANKALLAKHGLELAKLAEASGASLRYEAAVAGGIPIVKTLSEGLAGNKTSRLYGIMNGTCNYILTRMEDECMSFEDCLKIAQELGYAEADPTFDIGGHDTAHKLSILTSIAFGTEIDFDAVYLEGIQKITLEDIECARNLGYKIKLLGVAQQTDSGIEQRVHPTMVPVSSAIARIDGVTNAVAVEADFVGSLMLSGPGAGGNATATAVVADIADIAKGVKANVFGRPASELKPYERAKMRLHEGGYYLRLNVFDRPGAFAAIAQRMAEHKISLKSVMQNSRAGDEPTKAQPVVIITYETTEAEVRAVLEKIMADGNIDGEPMTIRIENLS